MTNKIDYIDDDFQGITNVSGRIVKVPFTNIGDEVEVLDITNNKHKPIATKYNIVSKVATSVNPICDYYTKCGGCLGQHFTKQQYLELKKNKLLNALNQHNINYSKDIELISYINNPQGYRRRAVFAVLGNKIGFNEFKSNFVVNINSCPLLTSNINLALKELQVFLKNTNNAMQISQIIISDVENSLDILILCNAKVDIKIIQNLSSLFALACVAKVSYTYKNSAPTLLISKNKVNLKYASVDVPFASGGFLQASKNAEETLQSLVVNAINNKFSNSKNIKVLDLFCGFGGYAFNLAKLDCIKTVHSYDINEDAIKTINSLNVAKITAFSHNIIKHPLFEKTLNNFNAIVTNPPRMGAGEQVEEIIKSKNIQQVVGVYCSLSAFINDVKMLTQNGFSIKNIIILDQFLFNPHIEIFIDLHKDI
jgi:23S rRNA (uracil1939-C5)-methyltransferase